MTEAWGLVLLPCANSPASAVAEAQSAEGTNICLVVHEFAALRLL